MPRRWHGLRQRHRRSDLFSLPHHEIHHRTGPGTRQRLRRAVQPPTTSRKALRLQQLFGHRSISRHVAQKGSFIVANSKKVLIAVDDVMEWIDLVVSEIEGMNSTYDLMDYRVFMDLERLKITTTTRTTNLRMVNKLVSRLHLRLAVQIDDDGLQSMGQ